MCIEKRHDHSPLSVGESVEAGVGLGVGAGVGAGVKAGVGFGEGKITGSRVSKEGRAET